VTLSIILSVVPNGSVEFEKELVAFKASGRLPITLEVSIEYNMI
jgi:hypothetical protein